MIIKIAHLKRSKPQDVIRLARFLKIETLGRMFEEITADVFNKMNAHNMQNLAWKW